MINVLVVDYEQDTVDLLKVVTEYEFKCVYHCEKTALEAIAKLNSTDLDFDIIIFDYRSSEKDFCKLFKENRSSEKPLPIIILGGGGSDIEKNIEGFGEDKNLDYYLPSPIKNVLFRSALKKIINYIGKPEAIINDRPIEEKSAYCSVSIETLKGFDLKDAEFFIKLGSEKYIKIKKNNDSFGPEDYLKYQNRGTKKLFIAEDYYKRLTELAMEEINEKLGSATTDLETKEVTANVLDLVYNSFDQFGITKEQIVLVNNAVDKCRDMLLKNTKMKSLIGQFFENKGYLIGHSMITMHVSYMIANNLGYVDQNNLNKLAYASIFHDLLLPNPEHSDIMNKGSDKFKGLSPEEKLEVLNHPIKVAELIEKTPEVPQDIYHIVLEHHELPDGSGFPKGLPGTRINQLSCIFIIALRVADHLYYNQFKNLKSLVTDLNENYNKGNFRKPLEAFLQSFKS